MFGSASAEPWWVGGWRVLGAEDFLPHFFPVPWLLNVPSEPYGLGNSPICHQRALLVAVLRAQPWSKVGGLI